MFVVFILAVPSLYPFSHQLTDPCIVFEESIPSVTERDAGVAIS